MTTKEYLQQISRLDKIIRIKLVDLHQLETMATSVKISYSEEKVQTSLKVDRLANAVEKIVDTKNETADKVEEYIRLRKKIMCQLDDMIKSGGIEYSNYYYILSSRYVEGKSFNKIAKDMDYSRMQINRLHGKALIEFEKRYGQEYLKIEKK